MTKSKVSIKKKDKNDKQIISKEILEIRKEFFRKWHHDVELKAKSLGISAEEYIKRFKPKKNNKGDLWLGGKGLN